jgi:hypothetical protein
MRYFILVLLFALQSCDSGIPPCETDYNGNSFIVESQPIQDVTINGVVTIENVNGGIVCDEPLVLRINKPNQSLLEVDVPNLSDTIAVLGYTVVTDNDEWDVVEFPTHWQLNSLVDVTTYSVIEILFTKQSGLNQQIQVDGNIQFSSGGDSNMFNNAWQHTFLLN